MKSFVGDKSKNLRVLLVHNRYLISGGERQVFDAEKTLLQENGHEVETYLEDNLRISELGETRTALRSIWSSETYQTIRRRLKHTNVDIVHVHNFFPLISPSIYYAVRAEGIPLIQTLHNFRLICINGILFRDGAVCEDCIGRPIPWPGVTNACYKDSRRGSLVVTAMLSFHRAVRTWNRLVDTYIALTEFSRQKFIDSGLPRNKIAVKPNFLAKDPGIGTGKGRFAIFAGRLSPEKGIDTMLEAWKLLGDSIPLKILGDGPCKPKVIAAAESQLSIEYLGYLDNNQVLSMMQDALFLVFPTKVYENFPITIIEALATGLPVLTSNLGNTANIIKSGQTGLHFELGDPVDLANQVTRLVGDLDSIRDMRFAARATYEEDFTASSNFRILMDIYRSTLESYDKGS